MGDDIAGVIGLGMHVEGIKFDGGRARRFQDNVLGQGPVKAGTRDGLAARAESCAKTEAAASQASPPKSQGNDFIKFEVEI